MDYLGEKLLYLSRNDVESLHIPIGEIIAHLEKMFAQKAEEKKECG